MTEPPSLTRAAFLARSTLAVATAYGAASAGPFAARALAQTGGGSGGDRAIYEYALVLERLSSAFYARALKQVPGLDGPTRALLDSIRNDEAQHEQILAAFDMQFGGVPGNPPPFKFGDAFSSRERFLAVAELFEDTGVAALNSAGTQLAVKDNLATLASVAQVEARHAAAIRSLRGQPIAPSAYDSPRTQQQVYGTLRYYLPPPASP